MFGRNSFSIKTVCSWTLRQIFFITFLGLFTQSLFATTTAAQVFVYDSSNMQGGFQSGGWVTPQYGNIGTMTLQQGATQYGPGSHFPSISVLQEPIVLIESRIIDL